MSSVGIVTGGMMEAPDVFYTMPFIGQVMNPSAVRGGIALKKGNAVSFQVQVLDSSGSIVQNLDNATDIKFVLKVDKSDTDIQAAVLKNLVSGAIDVDTPALGYITVNLTSTDMNIAEGNYFVALQITYTAINIQELFLKTTAETDINQFDTISVMENTVHA